jgi:hypothetical protein
MILFMRRDGEKYRYLRAARSMIIDMAGSTGFE